MTTLFGTVLGLNNAPLVNMPVTLLGATTTKVVLTAATGDFAFPDLDDGEYKLIATHNELNAVSRRTVTVKDGDEVSAVILRLTAKEPESISEDKESESITEDNRFVRLKYTQYYFLMVVGLIFFIFIYFGVKDVKVSDLKDLETARGIITYLVAVTTIAMAAMLMLAAIMTGGRDLEKRFTLGKEILTTLIGVLGTIIGFYYGSAVKSGTDTSTRDSTAISVNELKTTPLSPALGEPFNASATLSGGTPPYDYKLTIDPTGTAEPILASSQDGRINEAVTFMDSAKPGSITLILSGKDARNAPFSANKIMDIK